MSFRDFNMRTISYNGLIGIRYISYTGPTGPFFTPSINSAGVISWTNNGGLDNPPSINIRGPKGDTGDTGSPGQPGADGVSPVITVTNIMGEGDDDGQE